MHNESFGARIVVVIWLMERSESERERLVTIGELSLSVKATAVIKTVERVVAARKVRIE